MERLRSSLLIVVAAGSVLTGCVELKHVGRTVGHTSKHVAKDIGHASKNVAKQVSKSAKRIVKEATKNDCSEGHVKKGDCQT